MKVKVISDGTTFGTKVVNIETGEEIENVTAITWSVDCKIRNNPLATVDITLHQVPVEVVGEVTDIQKKDFPRKLAEWVVTQG